MVNQVLLCKAYNESARVLSFESKIILDLLFQWFRFNRKLNNLIVFEDKIYQWVSIKKLISEFQISRSTVEKKIKELVSNNFIFKKLDKSNNMYLSINFDKYKTIFNDDEEICIDRIEWIDNYLKSEKDKIINKLNYYNNLEDRKDMNNGLFEIPEKQKKYTGEGGLNYYNDRNKIEKNYKYGIEAYTIAVKLIKIDNDENREKQDKLYKMFAKHEYKDFSENYKTQTKTFNVLCQNIQNIYDGTFLRPIKEYNKNFLNTAQLPVDYNETKKILDNVVGDWKKVKKLILNAYENFCLMHLENYCPCDKHFLRTTMKDWFECNDNSTDYQSQFIQCLFEIPLTKKFYSEKKADRIFGGLFKKSCDYGEELIDLNPSMNSGTAWENIKKMVEWAKLLLTSEQNAKYWIETPSHIIKKFVEWTKNNSIQINTNSFNIEWCINNNGPWVWFIQNVSKEYKFNSQLVNLVTEEDFLDCYKSSSGISFDDMKEVIF